MSSQGLTVTQVQDAIGARIEKLWGPKDGIPMVVAGALAFIAAAATVITVSIYARKNHWMPTKHCREFKEVDGKRVCASYKKNYLLGPILFGTLAGIPGSILVTSVAVGVTASLISIPKKIKECRLESEKTKVTGDNAMQILHKHIRYLSEETLSSCAKTMTFSQLASLKEPLPDDQFWRLATDLPESGHKRCAWRLLRDLKDAEDQPAFVKEHRQTLRDYAERFEGFSKQPGMVIREEKALPKLAGRSSKTLRGFIKKELERPNPTLRKQLKEAARARLTSENAKAWVTFLKRVAKSADLSVDRDHPIASYRKSYDEQYMDLLSDARELTRRKAKGERRCESVAEESTKHGPGPILSPGHPALDWLAAKSKFFEGCFACTAEEDNLDFSEEPPEVRRGIAYLIDQFRLREEEIKASFEGTPRGTPEVAAHEEVRPSGESSKRGEATDETSPITEEIKAAIQTMLEEDSEVLPDVVEACRKFQLFGLLEEIENQLEEKITSASEKEEKFEWLRVMPESEKLIKGASAHLSGVPQSQLIARLKATEDPLEEQLLKAQITRNYEQRTVLRELKMLDELARGSTVEPPDLKCISDHDDRVCALADYEARTHRDVRNALRDQLALGLETPGRIKITPTSLLEVWKYAEGARDERLMSACAEFLSHTKAPKVLKELPDLWDGRIPKRLYAGWRRNPRAQAPATRSPPAP